MCTNLYVGLKILSDRELPCEAGHGITFSLNQPEGMSPLTLGFPYPVLTEGSGAFNPADRTLRVVLKKALNEPWPSQFREKPKWNVEQFAPWNDELAIFPFSKLMVHIGAQQGINPFNTAWDQILGSSECKNLLPVEVVRNLIGNIFCVSGNGHEFFSVYNLKDSQEPLWNFRVHTPFLTSPTGTPMLLVSGIDNRLAVKLTANGNVKEKQAQDDFQRIFGQSIGGKPIQLIVTDEAAHLLRYLLRLNSTKMTPICWQNENLPLGKYSPYLATFLTPLYLAQPQPGEDKEDKLDQMRLFLKKKLAANVESSQCSRCLKKTKVKLQRCSKCKLVYYCTVECQRADWSNHKILCR